MTYLINSFSIQDSQENRDRIRMAKIMAAKDGWSFSELLFNALCEYLDRHAPGNPQLSIQHWTENLPLPISTIEKKAPVKDVKMDWIDDGHNIWFGSSVDDIRIIRAQQKKRE